MPIVHPSGPHEVTVLIDIKFKYMNNMYALRRLINFHTICLDFKKFYTVFV